MTNNERAKAMTEACTSIARFEGGKQRSREVQVFKSCSIDDAQIRASAAVMRMLTSLRELSYSRDITTSMIQAAIEGFYDAAEIEEERDPMGAIIYKRKVTA